MKNNWKERFKEIWLTSFVGVATDGMGYKNLESLVESLLAEQKKELMKKVEHMAIYQLGEGGSQYVSRRMLLELIENHD